MNVLKSGAHKKLPWRRALYAGAPKRAFLAASAVAGGIALLKNVETRTGLGIHCVPTPQNLRHLDSIQALKKPYVLFPNSGDGHLETLAGALLRERPEPPYRRELLQAPDGGTVSLDWHAPLEGEVLADPCAPVLILIPGLTGGSDARYIRHAVLGAAKRGMRAVVYNHCGVCGSPVTSPRLYSACFTGDLRLAVAHIAQLFPGAPLLAAGFSIGANVLVHYLAEEADARRPGSSSSSSSNCRTDLGAPHPRLAAAVSLCNPFNLTLGDWNWRRPDAGFRRAYDKYLAGTKTAPAAATIADAHSPQGFSASSMPADPHPGRNAWAQSQRPDLPITPADQAALTQVSGLSPSSGAKDSSSSSSGGGGGGSDGAVAEAAPSSPPFSGSAPATGLALPCVGSTGSSDPIHGSAPEKSTRFWPTRLAKPLLPVSCAAQARPEDARRAATVRDFDDAATRHWFGFASVDEYYAAASSGYHLHAVDTPLLCISAEDDPICPKEAIPMDAFDNPELILITTPTGGHLGWVDLSPGGGGWRGRPWTEDVMFDFLQSVTA